MKYELHRVRQRIAAYAKRLENREDKWAKDPSLPQPSEDMRAGAIKGLRAALKVIDEAIEEDGSAEWLI